MYVLFGCFALGVCIMVGLASAGNSLRLGLLALAESVKRLSR